MPGKTTFNSTVSREVNARRALPALRQAREALTLPQIETPQVQPVELQPDGLNIRQRTSSLPELSARSVLTPTEQLVPAASANYSASGKRGPGFHAPKDPTLPDRVGQYRTLVAVATGVSVEGVGQWRAVGTRPKGGAARSRHYDGLALDVPLNVSNADQARIGDQLAAWANSLKGPNGPFSEVIWRSANHYNHVHLGINENYQGPLPAIPRFK